MTLSMYILVWTFLKHNRTKWKKTSVYSIWPPIYPTGMAWMDGFDEMERSKVRVGCDIMLLETFAGASVLPLYCCVG